MKQYFSISMVVVSLAFTISCLFLMQQSRAQSGIATIGKAVVAPSTFQKLRTIENNLRVKSKIIQRNLIEGDQTKKGYKKLNSK